MSKVYVVGHRPIDPSKEWVEYEVQYSAEPTWIIPERSEAERDCGDLIRLNVRTFDGHHCDFAVESLDEGRFTIVCLSHPEHLRLAATEPLTLMLNNPAKLTEVAEQRGMTVQALKEDHAAMVAAGNARMDGNLFISLDAAGSDREPIIDEDSGKP